MAAKKLTDKHRKFLQKVLNIGIYKLVPTTIPNTLPNGETYMLDLTIDKPDHELYDDGECWSNDTEDIYVWVTKILNEGVYDKESWDTEKLNSLGIYYKRYLKENMTDISFDTFI